MDLKQMAFVVGAVAVIIVFGAFAVWLFGYLGQFVPMIEPG